MAGKGKSIILQIRVGLFIVQHVVCMYGTWKKREPSTGICTPVDQPVRIRTYALACTRT